MYYQWIPFVLIAQGIMCYLPHITWRLFHSNGNNKDFQNIISRANRVIEYDDDKRKNEVIRLAKALEQVLFQVGPLTFIIDVSYVSVEQRLPTENRYQWEDREIKILHHFVEEAGGFVEFILHSHKIYLLHECHGPDTLDAILSEFRYEELHVFRNKNPS